MKHAASPFAFFRLFSPFFVALMPTLLEAARNGDATQVAAILADPARQREALSGGQRTVARDVLVGDSGPTFHEKRDKGRTPLMRAAEAGHAECVKLLIPFSDLSAADECGATAIYLAAQFGRADCLRALIPFCDPAAPLKNGETPLMAAAAAGRVECVKLLIPVSDVDHENQKSRMPTALAVAVKESREECVALLLAVSKKAQEPLPSGKTLLMDAAIDGTPRLVEILLPFSDPHARDRTHSRTALMLAAEGGRFDTLALLLAASDLSATDHAGDTALILAAFHARPECVELLLPGSNPRALNQAKKDAIHYATLHSNPACFELLAPFADESTLARALARFGKEQCPVTAATLEMHQLRNEVKAAQPASTLVEADAVLAPARKARSL